MPDVERVIFRFPVPSLPRFKIDVAKDSKLLGFHVVDDSGYLFFMGRADQHELETRHFSMIMTGSVFTLRDYDYVGSASTTQKFLERFGGMMPKLVGVSHNVIHIFEVLRDGDSNPVGQQEPSTIRIP